MTQAYIATVALMALIFMSLLANRRFAHERRLPMQWSPSGAVNWTAPRVVALALTPLLAAVVLTATMIMTVTLTPKPGQEGYEVPVVTFISLSFIGVHALHLWLISRAMGKNRNAMGKNRN